MKIQTLKPYYDDLPNNTRKAFEEIDYAYAIAFLKSNAEALKLDAELDLTGDFLSEKQLDRLIHEYNVMNHYRTRAANALGFSFRGEKNRKKTTKKIHKLVRDYDRTH